MTTTAMRPVWLVSQGRVLASARLAESRAQRRRGLLGRDTVSEAIVLSPCTWVHTMGMRCAIDVAHVGHDGTVIATTTMRPWRVGAWSPKASFVVEAAAGDFERWNLRPGDTVEVRDGE